MLDYNRLTKAELINRLKQIEHDSGKCTELPTAADRHDESLTAVAESETRLRAILQTAIEAIITIDENGIVESVNPAAECSFGYSASEIVGQNVSILMPQPFRGNHDRYIREYLRSGRPKVIGIGREAVGQRKDGTVFPIDLSISEVRLADRRLFTGFVRDITLRKRLEQRQRILYSTTRALAESASLAEAAQKILGAVCLENGWVVGELWEVDAGADVLRCVATELRPGAEYPEFTRRAAALCFTRGQGFPGRVWSEKKPSWVANLTEEAAFARIGEARKEGVHSAFAFPILLADEVHGVMAFFSRDEREPDADLLQMFGDVGSQIGQFIQRKRAEQRLAELARSLAEKNKELETLVYVASHDLRSPLVNVQGFSKELIRASERVRSVLTRSGSPMDAELDEILRKDIPEAVEFIRASVAKMDGLLSGFLRFSRLGRVALQIERLRMQPLLANIGRTIDFQIQQTKAELRIEPAPDCMGDAMQINQVFSNLLDNALKYLDPKRPGLITVAGRVERGRAIYSVSDNGIGIAPEHLGRIFEIFHRLNPANGEGEGLGLSIAQRSLERQNGKIWVESEVGKGSTFYVALPAAGVP